MKVLRVLGTIFLALSVPVLAFAAGAHDGLNCVGCHGIHDAKAELIFAVAPNTKSINPRTQEAFSGTTALCLGCHESVDHGGMGIAVVSASKSHPFGVTPNPKIANVPGEFLRDGRLGCVGCHDPHPSNPNYKYLRVNTDSGANMQAFCGMCHSRKADQSATKDITIFNSMDERK